MRLKRLELFGFKSFADRTTFEFGDDTLTGVVGPNGCGKSNVVDAMRWVLGEQRAKSMRGAEMADVIFKGSSSRPGLSVAEVTMTLDNTIAEGAEEAGARLIEERGPEVMITRRVFKSGEGEYLIDGEKVRLKDVREMLFDTGLGSRGYSVLEQGKIDAVLSADPRERRRIFEEAAGISRYRQRKHEMELRTKRVEADCERLDDILGELRSRERSLKIQAGKAERYVTTRTEWMGAKTRLYRFKFGEVLRELDVFGGKLSEAESRAQELRDVRKNVEGEVTEREREREAVNSELERISAEAARVASEGRAVDERKSFLASRVQNLEAQSKEEADRASKLEQALEERREELESLRRSHEELTAQAALIQSEMAGRSRARREHESDYGSVRKEAQAASERVLALLHRRTELKNRLHHLEEAREPLAERAERIRNRADESREALRMVSEEDTRAQQSVVRCEAQVETADAERRRIDGEVQSLNSATKQAVEQEQNLDLERARIAGRLDSLRDSSAELADLGEGARKVLEACAEGVGPCGEDELQGLLADHLRVETRYARALDAVLGERARALVIRRGADAAREIADWLRREEAGVAGLSSSGGLSRLVAKTSAVGIAGDPLADDPRVITRLSDCVRTESEFSDLANWLCSDVWIAGDLDAALQLVADHPRSRFVTPEGELVDAAGLIGGHRSLTQGAVGRRAVAADFERELAEVTTAYESATARVAELREKCEGLEERRRAVLQELELARHNLSEARSARQTAAARRRDLEAARVTAEQEEAEVRDQVHKLEQDAQAAVGASGAAEEEFQRENAALSALEVRRKDLELVRDKLAQDEGRVGIELARIEEQVQGQARRIADLERVDSEATIELERARRLSGEHADGAASCSQQTEDLSERSATLQEERGTLDVKLRELRAVAASGMAAIESARRNAETIGRDLDQATEALSNVRLEGQKLELHRDELFSRIEDELELHPHDLLLGAEPVLRVERAEPASEEPSSATSSGATSSEDEGSSDAEALDSASDPSDDLREGEAPEEIVEVVERPPLDLDAIEVDEELRDAKVLRALEARVAELKRTLDRMGPVNMEALAELEEVSERLAFLDGQRDDLDRSKKGLNEALRTIDKESRRLFLEAFEEVRDNFRVIFRQLFGGGKADVILSEGEDVLDAGVEINARPPGREMLNIGLLSGGQRTMTALALLFAVFQARPSPFCVLDEVDAALDDANIQRFLAMLEGFRSTSQFVVVTHNKGTMADCETLYGITMETKGVSRHVMVELEEVDEFVPEAEGKARTDERELARKEAAEQVHFERLERAAVAKAAEARGEVEDSGGDSAGDSAGEPADGALDDEQVAAAGNRPVDPESGEKVVFLHPAAVGVDTDLDQESSDPNGVDSSRSDSSRSDSSRSDSNGTDTNSTAGQDHPRSEDPAAEADDSELARAEQPDAEEDPAEEQPAQGLERDEEATPSA